MIFNIYSSRTCVINSRIFIGHCSNKISICRNWYTSTRNISNVISRGSLNTIRDYSFINDPEFAGSKIYLSTDLISELMMVSGKQRYAEVQRLMESPMYSGMTNEEKIAALDSIAAEYNGVMEFEGSVMKDHTLLLLDAMQMMYEQRR